MVLWSALVAGLASSLGPCTVHRYLLVSAHLCGGTSKIRIGAFIAGSIGGYALFACAGAVTSIAELDSHVVYAGSSAMLLAAGSWTIFQALEQKSAPGIARLRSVGAHFVSGIGCTALGSPCCIPVALAFGMQSVQHDAGFAFAVMAAFGTGQVLPVATIYAISKLRFVSRSARRLHPSVPATVSGALLAAVGLVFGAAA